jgi:hypothetical protein
MRVPAFDYCDRTLALLLKTFIDIILLRKGPEHVPNSPVVLAVASVLLVTATFFSATLVQSGEGDSTLLSLLSSLLGYLLYWIVLAVTGFANRLVPTIASIMACGSILTILMVAAAILFLPTLGGSLTAIVIWLILIWSVPVKGHIIARAIESHWYTGIAIALTIFIMQYVSYQAMTGRIGI